MNKKQLALRFARGIRARKTQKTAQTVPLMGADRLVADYIGPRGITRVGLEDRGWYILA